MGSSSARSRLATSAGIGMVLLVVAACSSQAGASAGEASPSTGAATAAASAEPASAEPSAAQVSAAPPSAAPEAATSEICDPWLSPAAVESVHGSRVESIGGQMLNMGLPGMPEAPHCEWRMTDGNDVVFMQVQYDGDNSYVAFKVLSLGEEVKGVGDVAGFLATDNILYIAIGESPSAIIQLNGSANGQPLTKEQLTELGKQITAPPPPAS